ncbi:PE family protein [Mycobacterium bourgelatii]|uniref:PE domain-containing protein n=1 Tax=Mycobacterium bourgelatii TaxID=1273442 RepID=A0A7I9YKL6_MYCBU|nr:PE family protein [Mycobacterium bourgelatii]MCV6976870.1 PE family protein [Mycobacterium bourgelatii]GFG89210.1 hypothetical protein MBOU_12520 [Mycobacterium bourgelatii]
MSAVIVAPELLTQAAGELATIGETLNAAHLTAAAPTVAVLPAAADEVSAGIANLISGYGQEYQLLAGQAAAFHEQFVQRLTASASAYAGAEAVSVGFLQSSLIAEALINAIPGPIRDLLAGPLNIVWQLIGSYLNANPMVAGFIFLMFLATLVEIWLALVVAMLLFTAVLYVFGIDAAIFLPIMDAIA